MRALGVVLAGFLLSVAPVYAFESSDKDLVSKVLEAQSDERLLSRILNIKHLINDSNKDQDYSVDLARQIYEMNLTFAGEYLPRTRHNYFQLISKDKELAAVNGECEWVDAVSYVRPFLKNKRVVIINEAHNFPITRIFSYLISSDLSYLGFTHAGFEALSEHGDDVLARGYVVGGSGSYTSEPIMAETIRRAIISGVKIFSYDGDPRGGSEAREEEAFNNIKRVLDEDGSRIFLHVGYGHASKSGNEFKSIAARLNEAFPGDVYTIDQVSQMNFTGDLDGPMVKVCEGIPWSFNELSYDVSFFPPNDRLDNNSNRPVWIEIMADRSPLTPDVAMCHGAFPCLIEARRSAEPNGIPVDAFILWSETDAVKKLYLPSGDYFLTYTTLARQ